MEQGWEVLSGQRWIAAPGQLKALCNWSDRGEVKWESAKSHTRNLLLRE